MLQYERKKDYDGFNWQGKGRCTKYDKMYMTQLGNREWILLIECISIDRRQTRPWVSFKRKQHQGAYYQHFLMLTPLCLVMAGLTTKLALNELCNALNQKLDVSTTMGC